MFKRRIRLKTVDEVQDFVKAADKCSFDVQIQQGETLFDAKSIMGVMSLDLSEDLTVTCYGTDPELERILEKVACV